MGLQRLGIAPDILLLSRSPVSRIYWRIRQMSTTPLDTSRVEAFAEDLLSTLNRASISLMISIGHRTGLYDTMAKMAPAASTRIAEESGLNERYVREWLG